MGDGGGAALDLHQWDLIFSCHQDVFLVVEHSSQVHAPNEINEMDQIKRNYRRKSTTEQNRMCHSSSVLQSDCFYLCQVI